MNGAVGVLTNSIQRITLATLLTITSLSLHAQDPVADNMLLYQRSVGGWPKHVDEVKVDYSKTLSEGEKAGVVDDKFRNDATIDNGATSKEIRYLVKAFAKTGNRNYLQAAEGGIRYLLQMQYANGGFPQFYPDSSSYRNEITYNDNAMINALNILWDVAHRSKGFDAVDPRLIKPAEKAVAAGIECILNTQVKVNGRLTVWCAQYDRKTLRPAKARAFELVSLSGSESVGIVQFLMQLENPSPRVKQAIESAIGWFRAARIDGYEYTEVKDPALPKGFDRVLQAKAGSTVWARFYDIDTNRPFFAGRDGQKKWSVAEIEYERRTGYAWYGTWAAQLLEKDYPEWKKKNP